MQACRLGIAQFKRYRRMYFFPAYCVGRVGDNQAFLLLVQSEVSELGSGAVALFDVCMEGWEWPVVEEPFPTLQDAGQHVLSE